MFLPTGAQGVHRCTTVVYVGAPECTERSGMPAVSARLARWNITTAVWPQRLCCSPLLEGSACPPIADSPRKTRVYRGKGMLDHRPDAFQRFTTLLARFIACPFAWPYFSRKPLLPFLPLSLSLFLLSSRVLRAYVGRCWKSAWKSYVSCLCFRHDSGIVVVTLVGRIKVFLILRLLVGRERIVWN